MSIFDVNRLRCLVSIPRCFAVSRVKAVSRFACVLLCFEASNAIAFSGHSAWMWQKSSHPYGSANVLGDSSKEAEALTIMKDWGFDRIYLSTGTRSITEPATVANWISSLDDAGLNVQFLISEFGAATEPDRTSMLNKIQTRMIDYNNSRIDPREHFDSVHLDIEPHTTDEWDNGSPTDKRDLMLELKNTYNSVRSLLDAGGQTNVQIYADIPVWYDSSTSIGWTNSAERDQWFQDIAVPLDGLSMMAYERSTLASILSGVTYEANHFEGEVRVGLNNKEIGPGNTFEDFDDYMTIVESLSGDIGITIGGVDHHTFYLLAELSPEPQLSGDFNQDGIVNAADYTLWRDTLGSTINLAADGNDDGVVNRLDYDIWKNNYGFTLQATNSTTTAIPEPISSALALTAICFAFVRESLRKRVAPACMSAKPSTSFGKSE